jgi:hypothetical protein
MPGRQHWQQRGEAGNGSKQQAKIVEHANLQLIFPYFDLFHH